MDPHNFAPFNNPMTCEMDWFNRVARDVNPLEHMAGTLNPLENMANESNALERISRGINPVESMLAAQDAVSRCIREAVMPPSGLALPEITPEASRQWLDDLSFTVETPLSDFEFPKPPESRTPTELEAMSDDEIANFLSRNVSVIATMLAVREQTRRQLNQVTRPHWTTLGTFWSTIIIGVLCIAIGAISVYLTMR